MSVGIIFGLTNGIITMLSVITGLYATKVNRVGIIGAIFALLITDPLIDAYSVYSSQKPINKKKAFNIGRNAFLSQVILQIIFLLIIIFSSTVKQGLIISYISGFIMTVLYNIYSNITIEDTIKNLLGIATLVFITFIVDKNVYKFFKQ